VVNLANKEVKSQRDRKTGTDEEKDRINYFLNPLNQTNMKLQHIIFTALTIACTAMNGQDKITAKFNSEAWEIDAKYHQFKEYKQKQALFLDQGRARLKNSIFKDGIIEYDISFERVRNFAGIHFRIQDKLNYEEYYMRPHQSGNPDAMQYTPVVNGNSGWQLYSGEGYWASINYNFGEWMHVKLIVSGNKLDVFVDDMEKPVLHVSELKLDSKRGGLGFRTFLGAAYYANLTYREIENPELVSEIKETPQKEAGIISDWNVSEAFSNTRLNGIISLDELRISTDKHMTVDGDGVLNLSHVSKVSDTTNTVLAKFNKDSDREQRKKMEFGYSDKVTVFVNGSPVYSGDDSFRSRDYRFLGSIGFFDTIHLNLKEGNNEVVFAVSEKMGGWGLVAKVSE